MAKYDANNNVERTLAYTYGYDHQRIRMLETASGSPFRAKTYVGSCEYNHDPDCDRTLTYLSAPTGVFAVHVTEGTNYLTNTDQVLERLLYLHKDHLGSITTITDASGTIQQELSFDAWGNLRNPSTWSGSFAGTPLIDRGFTGHEHLYGFGLINMNGRMYDPVMSSFFSPDNYIQAPDFSQSFNRYSYCLNNPLRYTDPSGELFGTVFGVISDIINNVFVRTFEGEKWDWTQTKLGWKIDMGLFHTDPNKSDWGKAWEIGSRLIWQLPQTVTGDLFVSTANAFGAVNDVTHGYGITAVDMGLQDGNAVTIGHYTSGPNGYKADWHDHMFVHEYGHYVQSQRHGLVYLLTIGIPSLQSAIIQTKNPSSPRHINRWFEADASYKGSEYFDKYYGSEANGYFVGSPDFFDKESFINGTIMPYTNPRTGSRDSFRYPISGEFHWTDIPIYIPILGLFPVLFYL